MRTVRSWLAAALGIRAEAAQRGDWWEIDLIIVVLVGSAIAGALAWA